MNRVELEAALILGGVPTDAYELHGRPTNRAFTLAPCPAGWEVYYAEDGRKTARTLHDTEAEACADLWERLAWAWRPDA